MVAPLGNRLCLVGVGESSERQGWSPSPTRWMTLAVQLVWTQTVVERQPRSVSKCGYCLDGPTDDGVAAVYRRSVATLNHLEVVRQAEA